MHNRTRAIGLHIIDAVIRSKNQSVVPRNEMNKGDKAFASLRQSVMGFAEAVST